MALSGSITTNKYSTSSHGDIGLQLSWSATQSIANNTSTIKWTLKSVGSMSSGYYVQAAPITVVIAGKTVVSQTSRFNMKGGGGYKKTGSFTVTHNADGTKAISASIKAAIYSASVNCTASGSWALNKINRYALISAVDAFTDETNPKITFTNPAGTEMVTNLKIRMVWKDTLDVEQSTSYVNIPEADWAGGDITLDLGSYRNALRTACPNSSNLSVTFDLQSTMNETDYHHEKASSMEIVNASPIANTVSYLEMDDNVYEDVTHDRSIIIQKQSTLRIKMVEATAQKASSIASYGLNFNGVDYVPSAEQDYVYTDFVKPDISGTYTATFTITDSRGFVTTTSIDIPVLDWAKPTADVSLIRQNGFENNTDLDVTPHISSLGGLNSVHIYQKNRIINTQVWSQEVEVLTNPSVVSLANTNEWEMIVRIEDVFESEEYRVTVGKGIPLIFFDAYRNSFAFNEIPDDDDQVKIGGKLKVKPNDTDAGIVLPHTYSDTEQIVGYWIDGSPIYEKTIEFQSAVTINANSWSNNVYTNDENIIVLNGEAYYYDSNSSVYVYWGFMAIQSNTTDKTKINLYNSRDSSCQVSILVIRYIKPTQNNG